MKKISLIVLMMIMILIFASCRTAALKESTDLPNQDRQEFLDNKTDADTQNPVKNEEIDAFIKNYNAKASDKNKIENYRVFSTNDSFLVVTDTKQYRIRLDENGTPFTMTLINGSIEEKVQCTNIVMHIMWNKEYVPADIQVYINDVHDQINSLSSEIENFINESKNEDLDTSIPNYEELKEKINTMKNEFESYKDQILSDTQ